MLDRRRGEERKGCCSSASSKPLTRDNHHYYKQMRLVKPPVIALAKNHHQTMIICSTCQKQANSEDEEREAEAERISSSCSSSFALSASFSLIRCIGRVEWRRRRGNLPMRGHSTRKTNFVRCNPRRPFTNIIRSPTVARRDRPFSLSYVDVASRPGKTRISSLSLSFRPAPAKLAEN